MEPADALGSPTTVERPLPLTCVTVVCRAHPGLTELPYAAHKMDEFLDFSPRWSFSKACASRSLRLVARLAARDALAPSDSLQRDPLVQQWQFSGGVLSAIKAGDLTMVQWLVTHFEEYCRLPVLALETAAQHGQLEILRWLAENRVDAYWTGDEMEVALAGNHGQTVRWLRENARLPPAAGDYWALLAAKNGDLEAVQWFFELMAEAGLNVGDRVSGIDQAAVDAGQLAVLQWLHDEGHLATGSSQLNLNEAATNGHLEVLQWVLLHYKQRCNKDLALSKAAFAGHLSVVQLLHAEGIDGCSGTAMDDAAAPGHLDIVKWLHEHRTQSCTTDAMDKTSMDGHLDVVQWLHTNRSEGCTPTAMDGAAANGHLEIVQWLHDNRMEGCTTLGMDVAAMSNHLEIIQWLHLHRSEGCTTLAMDGAATDGYLSVVQWLHENRSEGCTPGAMNGAASEGHLEMVRWLHDNRAEGCTTDAMDLAAAGGHLEVVQWLHANRDEGCTVDAMDQAASKGHLQVVQWLHANRSEGCTTDAMDNAAAYGHLDVVAFLSRERNEGCTTACMEHIARSLQWEFLPLLYPRYPAQLAYAQLGGEAYDWLLPMEN